MKIETFVRELFNKLGLDVRRHRKDDCPDRGSLLKSMQIAASIGFSPNTILDVGAARGEWTAIVSQVWPKAKYVLIDPLAENEIELRKICLDLKNAEYRLAVAAEQPGVEVINIHPDLDGSSLFLERETNINGAPRQVPAVSINSVSAELGLKAPFLIKADVQGAEMKVLNGAGDILPDTELLVLEVVLFDIYQGKGPQLHEIVPYMKSKRFVIWDIFGLEYRMVDLALCQVDMVFVRDDGVFRKVQQYATDGQRIQQLRALEHSTPERVQRTK